MRIIKTYLHNDYEASELRDENNLDEKDVEVVYNALYEVPIFVDLDTGKLYLEDPSTSACACGRV